MKFTTDGLIIKTYDVGENDRSVVVLTRDRGIVGAFVSGARKVGSKNAAGTALLTFSSLTFTQKGETNRITESESIRTFFDLRTDIEKYALAEYICELCTALIPYGVEDEDYLRLALNSLHFLSNGSRDVYFVKAVTELRLMVIAGFMPDLIGCRECGSDQDFPLFLDIEGGDTVCAKCKAKAPQKGVFLELDRTTLAAARHITYAEFQKLYSFALPKEHAKYLSTLTERYLLSQTDRKFKTLDFFHSIESFNV